MSTVDTPVRAPMPFTRLLYVQLRSWRCHRGITWLTGIALLLGLAGIMFATRSLDEHANSAAVATMFRGATGGYSLLWLAIGVLTGATPFRAGWVGMIVSIAQDRVRWLAASYLSVLCWAVGTTVLFGALSSVIITGRLAERGPGIGVVTSMPSVVAGVLVSVTVGFALGSAARSVAIPLMLGYVGATALPLLDAPSKGLTRAIDLDTARAAIAGAEPPHGIGLVIVALCVWTVVPAALAVIRLRRGDLR